jgi:hypothetical protein
MISHHSSTTDDIHILQINEKYLSKTTENRYLSKKDEFHLKWLIYEILYERFRYEKIWCASWVRVNLPHISNKKSIKIVLQQNLLKNTQYPFSVEICIGGTVGLSNIKILSVYFCSWTPKLLPKVPSDSAYGAISLTKLKFNPS